MRRSVKRLGKARRTFSRAELDAMANKSTAFMSTKVVFFMPILLLILGTLTTGKLLLLLLFSFYTDDIYRLLLLSLNTKSKKE